VLTEDGGGSTVPRRTLGLVLREARTEARFTMQAAADALGVSIQTVRRIEQGTVSTRTATVTVLCSLYEVDDAMRHVLLGLAKETRSRGWWHSYGEAIPAWFQLYVSLEQTASRMRMFDPMLVTGLLQDEQYMEAAIRAVTPALSDEEVAASIKVRLSRQRLLTRAFPAAPQVEVILQESVLSARPQIEEVMRAQVWHLLKATELPSVSVQVLPIGVGPHLASVTGAFTMLDFPSENGTTPPRTVYSENLTGAIYLDKPSEIESYEEVWRALTAAALDHDASIAMMSHRLKELTER
jgi:transcriptional regulator with XRE-family HTH domain